MYVTMVNVCFDRVIGLLHCKGEWLKTKNKKEKNSCKSERKLRFLPQVENVQSSANYMCRAIIAITSKKCIPLSLIYMYMESLMIQFIIFYFLFLLSLVIFCKEVLIVKSNFFIFIISSTHTLISYIYI